MQEKRKVYDSMSSLTGSGNAEERARITGSVNNWKPSVFDFKSERSGSTCPTCRGSGRIPKGQESELVALIPYNDKRLKPPRTCLYVCLVTALLIASGGVVTAFLYPRSVTLHVMALNTSEPNSNYTNTTCSSTDNHDTLALMVKTIVNVKNSNFFPVSIRVLNVTLQYSGIEVGLKSTKFIPISSRSSKNVTVTQYAMFISQRAAKVNAICCTTGKWKQQMYMSASAVAEYTYLSQSSTSLDEHGEDIICRYLVPFTNVTTITPPIDNRIT